MISDPTEVEFAKQSIFQSFPPLDPTKAEAYVGYEDLPDRFSQLIEKVYAGATYLCLKLPDSLKLSIATTSDDWETRVADRHFTEEEKDAVREYSQVCANLKLSLPSSPHNAPQVVDTFPRLFELAKAAYPKHLGGTPLDQQMQKRLISAIFESQDINIKRILEISIALHEFDVSQKRAARNPGE